MGGICVVFTVLIADVQYVLISQITVETTRLKPDPTLEVELFAHMISYYKSSTHPGLTAM